MKFPSLQLVQEVLEEVSRGFRRGSFAQPGTDPWRNCLERASRVLLGLIAFPFWSQIKSIEKQFQFHGGLDANLAILALRVSSLCFVFYWGCMRGSWRISFGTLSPGVWGGHLWWYPIAPKVWGGHSGQDWYPIAALIFAPTF